MSLKGVMLIVFLATFALGAFLMWYGYRINRLKGSKRYHPGNRFVNMGLIVVVASGLALAMLGFAGYGQQ